MAPLRKTSAGRAACRGTNGTGSSVSGARTHLPGQFRSQRLSSLLRGFGHRRMGRASVPWVTCAYSDDDYTPEEWNEAMR
eukprot:CAMPEP_0118940788 /NCGR_PEP_ID=MMETSP1169-20130426/32316_1 /TAXON_ID=36882 /ORGANISM="Pyramimonas obovata, Strain CCMP722" /LENGTH=79 /DNA_ID=CAMNT_0006885377 /DNA_START=209 /DNA_END=445 /DNA_ORIENTATION=+